MLPPFNLPNGRTILVTDELGAPADFVLFQAVNELFKDTERSKSALVLSAAVDLARWKSVSVKYSVNLTTHIASGAVRFVDINCEDGSGPADAPRFGAVVGVVEQAVKPGMVVIVDDTASLEWIGHSPLDVWRFLRKLRAVCRKADATLLVRHHVASANDPDDLFLQLVGVCAYHLDVRPMYSGRSGAVSGEIALHAGPAARDSDGVKLIPRSSALQYRLTDNGPVYFEKGTGEAVL